MDIASAGLSANGLQITMLVDGLPAVAYSFGENPIQWQDREIAERIITPDNIPKDIVKNASYVCTLSLTADCPIATLLMMVCGDSVGRKLFHYKKPPRVQMTVLNMAALIPKPDIYTQGLVTSLSAGLSADATKFQDLNFIIAFHSKKL